MRKDKEARLRVRFQAATPEIMSVGKKLGDLCSISAKDSRTTCETAKMFFRACQFTAKVPVSAGALKS